MGNSATTFSFQPFQLLLSTTAKTTTMASMSPSQLALLAAEFLMTQHGASSRSVSALFAPHITGVSKTSLTEKFGAKAKATRMPPADHATATTTNDEALLVHAEHLVSQHGCSASHVACVLSLSANTLYKRVSRSKHKSSSSSDDVCQALEAVYSLVCCSVTHMFMDSVTSRALVSSEVYAALRGATRSIGIAMFVWTDSLATDAIVVPANRAKASRARAAVAVKDAAAARAHTAATAAALRTPAATAAANAAAAVYFEAKKRAEAAAGAFTARVLLNASELNSKESLVRMFDAEIELYLAEGRVGGSYMHAKFAVVDESVVYCGSMNFSVKGRADNVEVMTRDKRAVSARDFNSHLDKWIMSGEVVRVTEASHVADWRRSLEPTTPSALVHQTKKRARVSKLAKSQAFWSSVIAIVAFIRFM